MDLIKNMYDMEKCMSSRLIVLSDGQISTVVMVKVNFSLIT